MATTSFPFRTRAHFPFSIQTVSLSKEKVTVEAGMGKRLRCPH